MSSHPIDLAAIRHARLTFDMAPIPLYVQVAYMPDPHNDVDGTIVCMDLYSDEQHSKLLVDGVELADFPETTQREIEDELHRHLLRVAEKRQRDRDYRAFLAGLARQEDLSRRVAS